MKNTYFDLIDQSYYFPQEGFDLRNGYLTFHGLSLKHLIRKYGSPLRLMYLPKIGDQIKKARNLFNRAIKQHGYSGKYEYCYCTKCNHFFHVINEALKHRVNLETSSAFDIDLILELHQQQTIDLDHILIHNGYKSEDYLSKIIDLQDRGFTNSIIVLDSVQELDRLLTVAGERKVSVGLRMAVDEEPQSPYYTSRLGIQASQLVPLYREKIANLPNVELKMFHFFVDSGIRDSIYYWEEFRKAMTHYVALKKECPGLNALNLGGGFPIRNHLAHNFNYESIINDIITAIRDTCQEVGIDHPDIYTEFGKFTVGESGAVIFQVLEKKEQNDSELWYMVDNSLMNTIPDAWSIHEKFILLPINKWDNDYTRVNIGGLSCDHYDYYNSEDLNQQIYLPSFSPDEEEPLYIGFFHTGAYQDSISGYGGIKHCLIPSPKYVMIDRDEMGNFIEFVYREEQTVQEMFRILGYQKP
jgi:arginine decarboxylase